MLLDNHFERLYVSVCMSVCVHKCWSLCKFTLLAPQVNYDKYENLYHVCIPSITLCNSYVLFKRCLDN